MKTSRAKYSLVPRSRWKSSPMTVYQADRPAHGRSSAPAARATGAAAHEDVEGVVLAVLALPLEVLADAVLQRIARPLRRAKGAILAWGARETSANGVSRAFMWASGLIWGRGGASSCDIKQHLGVPAGGT